MKKKVLVIYASYGTGHKSIAQYVAKYIEENNKSAEIMTLDLNLYGNKLGNFGLKLFNFVTKKRQAKLFNACYELMDHKISTLTHNIIAKKSFDNEKLRNIIANFNPDVTISSHFYGSNIITYYNSIGLTHSKLYTIITDYWPHECWTRNHRLEDGYIVASDIVKEELVRRGVDSKKIYAFGLPLNISSINKLDSHEKILQRYNLKGDKKIYLFFGGSSSGWMYYFDYFKVICKLNLNADIIFICGKNKKLKDKCEKYVSKRNCPNILITGYSTDVLNLMKISDLVISKPGGATLTECLEMKVPMLLVPGIGGQEKYNAKFIVKKRFGIYAKNVRAFKKHLKIIEKFPFIIQKMHNRLQKTNNNKSVEKINNLISKV